MLLNSPIDNEPRDSKMSDVTVGSCLDCVITGDMATIVIITIVNAMSASIVKNCALFFIRSICKGKVVLFYFGKL